MGIFSRFLSFEKPMGETLIRLLYYLGIAGIVFNALQKLWMYITYLDDHIWSALWGIVKTPIMAIIAFMILRVVVEYVLAHFRIDKSLHDQVTGRAAPPKAS